MQSVLAPLIGPKVCVPPSLVGRTAIVTGGALGMYGLRLRPPSRVILSS